MAFGITLALLLVLFLTSHALSRLISSVFLMHVRNTQVVIRTVALFFFPGVLIHELAHFLMASLLFVPTGEIEFVPVVHGNSVKLGSVAIAKTDIFRRFLIGVAPLLFGLAVMMGIFWFLSPVALSLNWKLLVLLFTFFEIGNTMFSSQKDLEGAIGILIFAIIAFLVATAFHIPVIFWLRDFVTSAIVEDVFWKIAGVVAVVVALDSLFIGALFAIKKYLWRH